MKKSEDFELLSYLVLILLLILGIGLLFFANLGGNATSKFFPGMSKFVHVLSLFPFFFVFPIMTLFETSYYKFLPSLKSKDGKYNEDKLFHIATIVVIVLQTVFLLLAFLEAFPNLNEQMMFALSTPSLILELAYFAIYLHSTQKENKKMFYITIAIGIGLFILPVILGLLIYFNFGRTEGLILFTLLPFSSLGLNLSKKLN